MQCRVQARQRAVCRVQQRRRALVTPVVRAIAATRLTFLFLTFHFLISLPMSKYIRDLLIIINIAVREINARTARHRLGDALSLAATSLRLLNLLPSVPSVLKQLLEGFKRPQSAAFEFVLCSGIYFC